MKVKFFDISRLSFFSVLLMTSMWASKVSADASVVSISPVAEDVSTDLPPVPARLSLFGWSAAPNTTYTVVFSTPAEPALVVGIGAKIQSTQYDDFQDLLSVTLTYTGESILANSSVVLPERAFLIAIDPGVGANALVNTRAVDTSSRPCYGPAIDTSAAEETRGDFGDEDGLLDPPKPSDLDLNVGLPASAPGSYLSTNSFFWCIIPADVGSLNVGVKVLGPERRRDLVELFLSDDLVARLAASSNQSTTPQKLAFFSEGVQVSVDVRSIRGGIFTDASLLFVDGTASVGDDASQAVLGDAGDPITSRLERVSVRSTQTKLIDRSFELGVREAVSLAPSDTSPATSSLDLFGFVADEALFGEIIEVVRIQRLKCGEAQSLAVTGVVIGRDTIGDNGAFNLKIPTSAAFPNNNKTANIITRVVGNQNQNSRQISLANQTKNARR